MSVQPHLSVVGPDASSGPQNHRTVDRVTQILEEVTYRPGITFTELARALEAPKSSVHGFVRGLLAKGWLYEDDKRFYLGPAVYGLTMASGQIRAGSVTQQDLQALHEATGCAVFLGVRAGDHLIYVSECGTGSDAHTAFGARTNIRRGLLDTAGGKALLAEMSDTERNRYLRRRGPEEEELVSRLLAEFRDIKRDRIATSTKHSGTQYALAAVVRDQAGEAVAEITLIGSATEMLPREKRLRRILLQHVDALGDPASVRARPAEPAPRQTPSARLGVAPPVD
jgi:DNA-binding IclR family transcriptional regulator